MRCFRAQTSARLWVRSCAFAAVNSAAVPPPVSPPTVVAPPPAVAPAPKPKLSKQERKAAMLAAKAEAKDVVVQPPRSVPATSYQTFSGVTRLHEFRSSYAGATEGETLPNVTSVAGRVVSIRHMGKVVFITVRSDNETLQLVVHVGEHYSVEQLKELRDAIRVGDIVGATGQPGRTRAGELSLYVQKVSVLAPYVSTDLVACPDQRGFASIQDPDLRFRYRFLDMLTTTKPIEVFKSRAKLLGSLRAFLTERGFIEVETPIFHPIPGGAAAKPFATRHHASDSDLYLRVAPELYLKQCVVGGMERVFEVGRVFRNEDVDRSHNPEFTSCEFYQAYATYRDLIPMTEDLFRRLSVDVTGKTSFDIFADDGTVKHTIDLTPPFRQVSVVPELEKCLGVQFPDDLNELDTPIGVNYLERLFLDRKIPLPTVQTAAKLVDKLIDHFITDHVVQPTFVMDHPLFMSPLAKAHPGKRNLSERFELFVNGMEICNSYSELTDPEEQYRRFEQQMRQREMGDDETQAIDDTFLKALQVGLPPTAGWGMGIDRVLMLLTGTSSIREVIMFPLLRADCTHDARRRARTASFFGFDQHMTSFVLRSLEAELERCGETPVCNQLRQLRHTMETTLRRHDARRKGKHVDPASTHLGALFDLMLRIMCPPPRK